MEGDGAGALGSLERGGEGVAGGIDHVHLVGSLARHVHPLAVGAGRDAFGLGADLEGGDNLAAAQVDDAGQRFVLVGCVEEPVIVAEGEALGVRAALDLLAEVAAGDVDNADAVCGLVGGGSLLSSVPGGEMGEPERAT